MKSRRVFVPIAAALALALVGPAASADPERAFVGVKKCGMCHAKDFYGNQVEIMRAGPHARAFQTLGTPQAIEDARRAGLDGVPPAEQAACLECHVTAQGVPASRIKYELQRSDGVQCESCHGAGADYRKKSIMSDRDRAVANGLTADTEKVCESCHNSRSPHWDPSRYTRGDGTKVGFDYEQALGKIAHPIPKEKRHRIAELEKEQKGSLAGDE
jgi:hypothetical protein